MTETLLSEGIDSVVPDNVVSITGTSVETSAVEESPAVAALPEDFKAGLREFMKQEFDHFLTDVEWRLAQTRDIERRMNGERSGIVHTEDLNILTHQMTGYTMTANSPGAGSIAWTAVHIVFAGVDYTCADGSTNLKYTWFVKPGSGTTATMLSSNTKPVLTPNDCLVFVNNNGTPINALTSTIPVALADGAVDTGSIADGAITAAKTTFYTALNQAITDAQADADLALATADGSISTYFQAASPWANGDATAGGASNPANKVGDIWYDSDDGQGYRWSGAGGAPANTWILIKDTGITTALANANAAQTTANSKITTFYANAATPPTALAIGDLWVVTDQGNQLRRASATGTASWVTLQIGSAAIANGAVGDTQLGSGISGGKITAGSVTNTQLGTGIDGAKLTASTVTATQLANGAVGATKINTLQHIMF